MNKSQKNPGNMNYLERCSEPTPKFFKKLRTIGVVLAAVGGVLLAAPVALPAVLVTAGGYLITAGAVATAVSQAAVEDCGAKKKEY